MSSKIATTGSDKTVPATSRAPSAISFILNELLVLVPSSVLLYALSGYKVPIASEIIDVLIQVIQKSVGGTTKVQAVLIASALVVFETAGFIDIYEGCSRGGLKGYYAVRRILLRFAVEVLAYGRVTGRWNIAELGIIESLLGKQ